MKLRRVFVMAAVALAFSAMPVLAHADEHHGIGDYDQHHTWHDGQWWARHHPAWVQQHHPEWGDFDEHHHWHDRWWWVKNHRDWVEQHHHDWL